MVTSLYTVEELQAKIKQAADDIVIQGDPLRNVGQCNLEATVLFESLYVDKPIAEYTDDDRWINLETHIMIIEMYRPYNIFDNQESFEDATHAEVSSCAQVGLSILIQRALVKRMEAAIPRPNVLAATPKARFHCEHCGFQVTHNLDVIMPDGLSAEFWPIEPKASIAEIKGKV